MLSGALRVGMYCMHVMVGSSGCYLHTPSNYYRPISLPYGMVRLNPHCEAQASKGTGTGISCWNPMYSMLLLTCSMYLHVALYGIMCCVIYGVLY